MNFISDTLVVGIYHFIGLDNFLALIIGHGPCVSTEFHYGIGSWAGGVAHKLLSGPDIPLGISTQKSAPFTGSRHILYDAQV